MALVALTDIKHGKDDGEFVRIEAGESVTDLPSDAIDELKKSGSVVEASEYAILTSTPASGVVQDVGTMSDDALKAEFVRRMGDNLSDTDKERFLALNFATGEPENEDEEDED